ncbi:MAG: fumarylacetoacetate hydrolase family protein [Gemmatimonadota bacterium]|nr:fumarylacetoacetate hydrolase family protein [Gemmatimonadota bacterium]
MSLPFPSKVVCVGKNYAAHAAELGGDVPSEPLIFLKPPSAIIRAGDDIIKPTWAGRVDFEGEIGVVIGARARNVTADAAWQHVAGLAPINDVTARDLQTADGQWSRAKGFDTFCPIGSVTALEEVDVDGLRVTTRVNGEVRQDAPIQEMVFSIPVLIEHITRFMTLEPGDLIATGTPSGIGPLSDGDEVVIEVAGVGSVANRVREQPA